MQGPSLTQPDLQHERIRCSCQTDNLLVWPAAWYPHQQEEVIDAECAACGRSLLERTLPVGAVIVRYTPEALPREVALVLGAAVVDDFIGTNPTIDDGMPTSWSEPHEAGPAYEAWHAEQPVETDGVFDRQRILQNIGITALLAVVMAILAIL